MTSHSKQREQEERLTQDNLGLVISQACRFNPNNVTDLEDYIQAGSIGLLKAIRSYDPEKGKWSTYAGVCIAREIAKEARKFLFTYKGQQERRVISIDIEGMPEPEDVDSGLETEIKEMMPGNLTSTELDVLKYRMQGYTLQDIGNMMGDYSKQWSKNILEQAFKKIRASIK